MRHYSSSLSRNKPIPSLKPALFDYRVSVYNELMLILGIDPGTATIGYGMIKAKSNQFSLLDFGWIKTDKENRAEIRLDTIYKEMLSLLRAHEPDVLAIERLFFFRNQKTAMRVSQAHGVIMLAAARKKTQVYEYAPAEIKRKISGNGRADKSEMKKAVRSMLPVRTPKKKKTHFDDVADALAVALCHAIQSTEAGERKRS